jgi:hypothetical protein
MATPRRRLFRGVESAQWKLVSEPAPDLVAEVLKPNTPMVRALQVVLAKAHPEPLTVFEIGLELEAAGRTVPLGQLDEHSTIYQYLMNQAAMFQLVNGRKPS